MKGSKGKIALGSIGIKGIWFKVKAKKKHKSISKLGTETERIEYIYSEVLSVAALLHLSTNRHTIDLHLLILHKSSNKKA